MHEHKHRVSFAIGQLLHLLHSAGSHSRGHEPLPQLCHVPYIIWLTRSCTAPQRRLSTGSGLLGCHIFRSSELGSLASHDEGVPLFEVHDESVHCPAERSFIIHSFIHSFIVSLTFSLLDPSQRRVFRPSRRTRPFAPKGYEACSTAEASWHALEMYITNRYG